MPASSGTPRATPPRRQPAGPAAPARAALFALLVMLPWPRHWVLYARDFPDLYYEYISIVVYLSDAVTVAFLAAAALAWWQQRRHFDSRPPASHPAPARPVTLVLAALPIWAWVSAPWAYDPLLAAYLALRLAMLWLLYLSVTRLGAQARRLLPIALAASLLVQAPVGLAQVAVQHSLGLELFGEVHVVPADGFASVLTTGGGRWLRAYGLTPHPNILGGVLAASLLALLVPYLGSRGVRRWFWMAMLVLGGLALVATVSRGAWLGILAGASTLLAAVLARRTWRRRYGRALLLPALAAVLALAAFAVARPDLVATRLRLLPSQLETRSLAERDFLLRASLDLIARSPLLGVGAGGFVGASLPQTRGQPGIASQPVHNVPLLVTAELGLPGGVLWLVVTLAPLWISWRRWRARRLSLWALALTAGLVALAAIDLYDFYSWGWHEGRLLRWIWLGLWSSALPAPTPLGLAASGQADPM